MPGIVLTMAVDDVKMENRQKTTKQNVVYRIVIVSTEKNEVG